MTDETEVVRRAAEAMRRYEEHAAGLYRGPTAEEVLDEALGPCEGLDDLFRWAELARAAFRRARGRDASREPPTPAHVSEKRGGVPTYSIRADGTLRP